MKNLFGRRKILCDELQITADNIEPILQKAIETHQNNSVEIQYLHDYFKGKQKILNREKVVRSEIKNCIVENRANEIVSFKKGYLCGEPIQYVSRSSAHEVSDEISQLNDAMLLCGKQALDSELVEWMYVCGTGFRMISPNSNYIRRRIIPSLKNRRTDFSEDESPFEIHTLEPRSTFVIYHSGLGNKPLAGVTYIEKENGDLIYSVYTETHYFELIAESKIDSCRLNKKPEKRAVRGVPIIEYPLNNSRIGIFEVVLPLLDAINTVQSNRIDGVEQFIQSLMILYNCDIDSEDADKLRSSGLIKLKSSGDLKADIKILSEQLDQGQTQTLVNYMYQTVLNIVGMPNRNGGSSTSDTGAAVIMRDGWETAEARAKNDELMFKSSETALLKLVLQIVRGTVGTALKLSDIDVKFTRRNYENIANKSQVLVTMLGNPKIHPLLAFIHCGMFSDPEAAYAMSEDYWKSNEVATVPPPTDPQESDGVAFG